VVGADLLFQGEFLERDQAHTRTRRVKNPREAAAYTFGYNHSLFAQRVHDVLSLIAFAQARAPGGSVHLVGLAGAGSWVAAASAVAPGVLASAALDTRGFRFGAVNDLHSPDFLPGGAKYADLPGMLAVGMPRRLAVAGEPLGSDSLLKRVAQAYSPPSQLRSLPEEPQAQGAAVATWLLESPAR
jgi:hypothetical protein